ncbi:Uncharacterised protein [Cutibacterium granulosum]|uniref:Uncharacterized protein n=3 Tax=Cutibacterium granulosum TaxID=33011 RepID=A0A9X5LSB9_9ACTN|nr:hypothetical protein [Cutibacterium granulosum]ERF64612.1 hypothetical protein H640_06804 [Cutibacterium granulosum TM11]KAG9059534.1 hypothetical protein L860_001090 [Cutibacterium granulosum DSM 20700]MEA5639944.1 hypothetical protein [Cutibacterium granulosum]SNV33110.1 Uncharacterised protein [Cutibacterium granulosum]
MSAPTSTTPETGSAGHSSTRTKVMSLVSKLASIASAGMAAVIPIGILSGAGYLYDSVSVGQLAVRLAMTAYVAQVTGAALVEAPLFGKSGHRPQLPTLLYLVGFVGCAVWALGAGHLAVATVGLFLMLPSLECARAAAVLQGGWQRELVVGTVLFVSVVLVLVCKSTVALHVGVAIAVAIAIAIRMPGRWTGFQPVRGAQWWVVAETAIIGLVQPVALKLAYHGLGPSAATGLKFVMTIANVISPILYYLRLRLLDRHSRADIMLSTVLIVASSGAILIMQICGILRLALGPGWDTVTMLMLVVAMIWKFVTVVSTIPFTTLRRLGRGATVLVLRSLTTAAYIGGVLAALAARPTTTGVLCAFVLAEAASCVLFEIACVRAKREEGR